MAKMDAMPIYGKKPQLLFFSPVTVFLKLPGERSLPLGYLYCYSIPFILPGSGEVLI